jgi:polysaccharide deacetylase family protein (PEP-CTERM system associated)
VTSAVTPAVTPIGAPAASQVAAPAAPVALAPRAHVLTVSLEEYFHGGALAKVVRRKHWDRFEPRLDRSVDQLLSALDVNSARATFFVLGLLAERNPALVRRIVGAGHEIASRGFWPRGIADMQVEEFVEDLDRTALAIQAAGGGRVRGFRSPRWLKREDLWIVEVLGRKGYAYDSSVNPVGRSFAWMPEYHTVRRHEVPGVPGGIFEVPVSTASWCGFRVAIAGGNWMRQLPPWLLARSVARWERQRPDPLVFYLTSWEFDPEQPLVTAASPWSRLRHYRNLGRMRERLQHYLGQYRFVSIAEHLGLPAVETTPAAAAGAHGPQAALAIAPPAPVGAAPVSVSVVVPMYQEQENIPYLLRTLATVGERLAGRYRFEFVFVDDCSRDGTWEVLQQHCRGRNDVKLLRHEKNRGVAAAIMTGIRAASNEIVCSIDCDCSYDPMEIQHMVPRLGDGDLVTASPYHPDGQVLNVPRWRLFLSRTLSWIYRRMLGKDLFTWTSCFRVYRRSKVVGMELDNGGFLGIAEMLVRMLRRGSVVREYPTLLESRLLGASKMKTMRTVRGHVGLLWQVLRGRVR